MACESTERVSYASSFGVQLKDQTDKSTASGSVSSIAWNFDRERSVIQRYCTWLFNSLQLSSLYLHTALPSKNFLIRDIVQCVISIILCSDGCYYIGSFVDSLRMIRFRQWIPRTVLLLSKSEKRHASRYTCSNDPRTQLKNRHDRYRDCIICKLVST